MTAATPDVLTYNKDLFVNRRDELDRIDEVVRKTQNSERSSAGVIQVLGARGSGKSFLAMHILRSVYNGQEGRPSARLISFLDPEPGDATEREYYLSSQFVIDKTKKEELTRGILVWFIKQIAPQTPISIPTREIGSQLIQSIQLKYKNTPFILILDSVFEADWNLVEQFETDFLGGLAALPNVVFILTGRGRAFPFISTELRLGVETIRLDPFKTEQIAEQMREQTPGAKEWTEAQLAERANQIKKLGKGHPLSNYVLSLSDQPADQLDQAIEVQLRTLTKDERRRVRRTLEALSPLDGFREEEMKRMYAVREENSEIARWGIAEVRAKIREPLLKTQMVRWEDGRYVIDAAILPLLREYLKYKQLDVWRRLNREAYDLYMRWAKDFDTIEIYKVRAKEHYEQMQAS